MRQEAPAEHPALRTHRIGIGLYDLDGGALVRRRCWSSTSPASGPTLPALAGLPAADVLLLNDDDLTYAKIRLDERSLATVVRHIAGFELAAGPGAVLDRGLGHGARRGDAGPRLPGAGARGPARRADINLVTATLRQAAGALAFYADPPWAPTGWAATPRTAEAVSAAPGSGPSWPGPGPSSGPPARRRPGRLRGWLDGVGLPAGLTVDTELRWAMLQALVALGAAGDARDRRRAGPRPDRDGERAAATARALIPTPAAKAEVWRSWSPSRSPPNWRHRALLLGFRHPAQVALTEP